MAYFSQDVVYMFKDKIRSNSKSINSVPSATSIVPLEIVSLNEEEKEEEGKEEKEEQGEKEEKEGKKGTEDKIEVDVKVNGTNEENCSGQNFINKPKPHSLLRRHNKLSTPRKVTINTLRHDKQDKINALHSYYNDQYILDSATPSWKSSPEIPTASEVLGKAEPWQSLDQAENIQMNVNITEGAFPDTETYLRTHYEFFRDEAVGPLREAVFWFKKQMQKYSCSSYIKEPKKNHDFGIYDPVKITGLTFSLLGIAAEVTFSTRKSGVLINWDSSPRLKTGSIVVLSEDNFTSDSLLVAVIAAKDTANKLSQNPPKIDIFFATPDDIQIDPNKTFTMLECKSSFFEGQRHTLLALQSLAKESFGFQKAFVDVDTSFNNELPRSVQENSEFDFSSLYGPGFSKIDVNSPLPEEFRKEGKVLEPTQCDAVQCMLRNRLSIVQGPPGTGKTYTSVVVLKLLATKWRPQDPPIIVATQTNHALDQILGHIAPTLSRSFARLGGRSMDTGIVRDRAMFNLRKSGDSIFKRFNIRQTSRIARHEIKVLTQEAKNLLQPLSGSLPDVEHFVKHYILSREQASSLVEGRQGWVGYMNGNKNPLIEWLRYQVEKVNNQIPEEVFEELEEEVILHPEQVSERAAEIGSGSPDNKDVIIGFFTPLSQSVQGKSTEKMGDDKAFQLLENNDLNQVATKYRGQLYNWMLDRLKNILLLKLRDIAQRYNNSVKKHNLGRFEKDLVILDDQKIIGMTATGLSKYRSIIQALNPKIVLIEEAAEVLEAPVVVSALPSVEQIILVGDHQQLKPQCHQKDLRDGEFNFGLSLFERLINNKFEYCTLLTQRRMIPEICRLIRPIYQKHKIIDHECTRNRADVPGMRGKNIFAWKHNYNDTKNNFGSSENVSEAQMIVGFYYYLLHNGVQRKDITIITFYNAQKSQLLNQLNNEAAVQGHFFDYSDKDESHNFNVVTVDSYQGNENQIIILSLVRSNENNNFGFTDVVNRICVALSRARQGLYIFGNLDMLARSLKTKAWDDANRILSDPFVNGCGYELPIYCSKHQIEMRIGYPDQWKVLNGGCDQICKEMLSCGHKCTLFCHRFDHKFVECKEPCLKILKCGHKCLNKCSYQCQCQSCLLEVDRRDVWPVDTTVARRIIHQNLGIYEHSGSSKPRFLGKLDTFKSVAREREHEQGRSHEQVDKKNTPKISAVDDNEKGLSDGNHNERVVPLLIEL